MSGKNTRARRPGPAQVILEALQSGRRPAADEEPYLRPSSLAKGCLLYTAFELMGKPKPPLDARVERILAVGTDSHRRLQRALARRCLAQEVYFEVPEYRIRGFCDGLLYYPPEGAQKTQARQVGLWAAEAEYGRGDHAPTGRTPPAHDPPAGLWALEIKTTASDEFGRIKAEGPKEEHVRQAQIYLWGLHEYYRGLLPLCGAVILYENRDTLEHMAFEVLPDPQGMQALLTRVKAMLEGLAALRLPDDYLPFEHWAHAYCPYLDICEPGQKAIEWQKQNPKPLPDKVLAGIIADRIVRKQRAAETQGPRPAASGEGKDNRRKARRSLTELAQDLEWH